ncbi:MAG: hypothetical protein QF805_18485, partial [Pirellulaceae bacterium]|nr:hypothetical protein [Pirellulaceae bacterium]
MYLRSLTVAVALAVAVLVHAGEKNGKPVKVEPARGSVVGNLICSKCALNATEKCQTALLLAPTYAEWGMVGSDGDKFLTAAERLGNARKLSRDPKYAASQLAKKLGEKQFVLLAGKAGESLFQSRCSGQLHRVSGDVTLADGVATITGEKSSVIEDEQAQPSLSLAGKLVCSKCEFKVGECAAALKAGDLQVLLDGKAAEALFGVRCSGVSKVATGAVTKIDGKTVFLKVSKVSDSKA